MSIFHPTPTSLATAIHTALTRACSPHPSHSYKTALLATTIHPAVPVLTCLHHLSTSPHTTPSERALFASTHTRLAFLLAQEAARVPISTTQLLLNALLLDDLLLLFDADVRARGQLPLSDHLSVPAPPEDAVDVLLQATATALRTGCESFKGGVLRTSVSGPKQLLVALEGLCRDGRLEEEERRVFARAKEEVGRLWALQRRGGRGGMRGRRRRRRRTCTRRTGCGGGRCWGCWSGIGRGGQGEGNMRVGRGRAGAALRLRWRVASGRLEGRKGARMGGA
ncbi:hypothetical protein MMC27_005647 [Xylographa pallens]|nr:hypothetical protein [Xylographa pallens]